MRVTDEEDCVIVRLQHLKKVNICPTVDENKVSELKYTHTHTPKYYTQFRVTLHEKRQNFFIVNPSVNYSRGLWFFWIVPALCARGKQFQGPASLLLAQVCTGPGHSGTVPGKGTKIFSSYTSFTNYIIVSFLTNKEHGVMATECYLFIGSKKHLAGGYQ